MKIKSYQAYVDVFYLITKSFKKSYNLSVCINIHEKQDIPKKASETESMKVIAVTNATYLEA